MSLGTRPRPVFSIWAWLVLTPHLLTALGGVDKASTPREWLLGAATSLMVHLVLLGVFLGIGAIEMAVASRPPLRWTIVALAIIAIAVGRPLLVNAIQHQLGINLVGIDHLPTRMLLNAIVVSAGTLLTYALLLVVRRILDSRRRLLVVLAQLQAQGDRIDATAERITKDFQQEVRGPVLDALGALVAHDLPDGQLAAELQRVAHSVVRPLSHEVTDAGLEEAIAEVAFDSDSEPRTAALAAVTDRGLLRPTRIVPAPAWLVTLIAILAMLPPSLNSHGPLLGLGLLAAATAVSFLAALLIRAIPLPAATIWAVVVLTLEQLVLGSLILVLLLAPLPGSPLLAFYFAYGVAGYAMVAVVLAAIGSSLRELAEHQRTTAAAVAAAERRAFDARQRLASLSVETGRLLHTEIQGDLVATYLQLKLGTAGTDVLERLIERIALLLDATPLRTSDGPASALAVRDGIEASLDAWSLSLDLSVDIEPGALDRLAERTSTASLAHDAITEGLTNAVRHSRSDRAAVRIGLRPDDGDVEVVVASPGRIGAPGRGIGLRDLDARAREVTLTQVGGDVVLRVLV